MRVKRHLIGTTAEQDAVIYEEPDSGFFVKLGLTQSGAFVLIEASDHETSEVRLLDRADSRATPRLVETREVGLQYDVEHHGDDLIILTNADGAEDFKIMRAPVADPGPRPVDGSRPLPGRHHDPVRDGAVALSRPPRTGGCQAAHRRAGIRHRPGGNHRFRGGYLFARDRPGYEYDTSVIRYRYSSMTTPSEVTDLDLATGATDAA